MTKYDQTYARRAYGRALDEIKQTGEVTNESASVLILELERRRRAQTILYIVLALWAAAVFYVSSRGTLGLMPSIAQSLAIIGIASVSIYMYKNPERMLAPLFTSYQKRSKEHKILIDFLRKEA